MRPISINWDEIAAFALLTFIAIFSAGTGVVCVCKFANFVGVR